MKIINKFVGVSNNIKLIFKISFMVVLFAYFAFHSVNGDNGLISYIKTRSSVESQSKKLEWLRERLQTLQIDVKLLSNDSLDLDLLEERCRVILNYCYKDESVIRK